MGIPMRQLNVATKRFQVFRGMIVDICDTAPSPPGLFVISEGGGLAVKRIEVVPHSRPLQIRIIHDERSRAPLKIALDTVQIRGRVIAKWQPV